MLCEADIWDNLLQNGIFLHFLITSLNNQWALSIHFQCFVSTSTSIFGYQNTKWIYILMLLSGWLGGAVGRALPRSEKVAGSNPD